MSLLGKVELKTTELPDRLEFTVSREDGLIETVAIPAFALVVLWLFWRTGALWPRIIAGFAALSTFLAFLANQIQGGETTLRVTREELVAGGNLGQLFSKSITIAMRDVSSIRFDDGGDGGISGLYVGHGWKFTPVLPRLTREQSQAVVDAIRKKFPETPTQSATDHSLLGRIGQLAGLGLSRSSTRDTHEQE